MSITNGSILFLAPSGSLIFANKQWEFTPITHEYYAIKANFDKWFEQGGQSLYLPPDVSDPWNKEVPLVYEADPEIEKLLTWDMYDGQGLEKMTIKQVDPELEKLLAEEEFIQAKKAIQAQVLNKDECFIFVPWLLYVQQPWSQSLLVKANEDVVRKVKTIPLEGGVNTITIGHGEYFDEDGKCIECGDDEDDCGCCEDCHKAYCECCTECGNVPGECECCENCESSPCNCCQQCEYPSSDCQCCSDCGNNEYNCTCCGECGGNTDAGECTCCGDCGESESYCCCNNDECQSCGSYSGNCGCDVGIPEKAIVWCLTCNKCLCKTCSNSCTCDYPQQAIFQGTTSNGTDLREAGWIDRGIHIANVKPHEDWSQVWNVPIHELDPVQVACDYYLLEALRYDIPNRVNFTPVKVPIRQFLGGAGYNKWEDSEYLRSRGDNIVPSTLLLARDTIVSKAEGMFQSLVNRTAHPFAEYANMVISGELRYHRAVGGRLLGSSRSTAWSGWKRIFETVGPEALTDAAALFRDIKGESVGGELWAIAAETVRDYYRKDGKLPPHLFLDRLFTICHNGGSIFNKLGWVRSNKPGWHVGNLQDIVLPAHGESDWKILLAGCTDEVTSTWAEYWEITNRIKESLGLDILSDPGKKLSMRVCRSCSVEDGHSFHCNRILKAASYGEQNPWHETFSLENSGMKSAMWYDENGEFLADTDVILSSIIHEEQQIAGKIGDLLFKPLVSEELWKETEKHYGSQKQLYVTFYAKKHVNAGQFMIHSSFIVTPDNYNTKTIADWMLKEWTGIPPVMKKWIEDNWEAKALKPWPEEVAKSVATISGPTTSSDTLVYAVDTSNWKSYTVTTSSSGVLNG